MDISSHDTVVDPTHTQNNEIKVAETAAVEVGATSLLHGNKAASSLDWCSNILQTTTVPIQWRRLQHQRICALLYSIIYSCEVALKNSGQYLPSLTGCVALVANHESMPHR